MTEPEKFLEEIAQIDDKYHPKNPWNKVVPLTRALGIIFDIKHLRTCFRHDPDLVDKPKITKKLIVQVCSKYTGKTTIIGLSSNDFLEFQTKLFIEIISFLKKLQEELLSS